MDRNRSLVPKPPSAIENVAHGAQRLVSGMVTDTLALAKPEQLPPAKPRFRCGDYEWAEPDFQQILLWAQALALKPEDVIQRLRNVNNYGYEFLTEFLSSIEEKWEETCFDAGKLLKIHWNFAALPLDEFRWMGGLLTTHLSFRSENCIHPNNRTIAVSLPHLSHLACMFCGVTSLPLSAMPQLRFLVCAHNQLRQLELSAVGNLEKLNCFGNEISALDLSAVPNLRFLSCGSNAISVLDIRPLSNLTGLNYDRGKTRLIKRSDQRFQSF